MKTLSLFRLWLAYWVMPKKSREALRRLAEGSHAINPAWTSDDVLKALEKLK
jgi:hypothetical protein